MRPIATRLGVLAVGLGVGLVLAEVLLRISGLGPGEAIAFVDAARFGLQPGLHAPNQQLVVRSLPALPFRARIDSLGLRGPDFPRAKPAGEIRVFLIGDSYGFGAYLDDDSTLTAQLERALRASCGDVRVINGSFGGSTITEQRRLIARGLLLAPDLVLLEMTDNDVADLQTVPSEWDQLANDRAAKARLPMALVYPLLRHAALWRVARAGMAGIRTRQRARQRHAVQSRSDSLRRSLRGNYRQQLLALRDTLAALQVPFAVATFPDMVTMRDSTSDRGWAVGQLAEAGIPHTDAAAAMIASGLPDTALFLLPHDTHPSARAYGLTVEPIVSLVRGMAPLAGRCAPRDTARPAASH